MTDLRLARGILGASLVVALLCVALPASSQPIPDPFLSNIASVGAPMAVCPAGDLPGCATPNADILVQVRDAAGSPILGLVPGDFEVDGSPLFAMADAYFPAPNDHNVTGFAVLAPGDYLLNSPIFSGGNGMAVNVKVRNVLIVTGSPLPHPFVSPDLTGDGVVNLSDIGNFSFDFFTGYNPRSDFNFDGIINLVDIGTLAMHNGHTFPPGAVQDVD